jgi:hypothetical protein
MSCHACRTYIIDFITDADWRIMVLALQEMRIRVLISLTLHSTYGMVALDLSL